MPLLRRSSDIPASPDTEAEKLLSALRLIVGLEQVIDHFSSGIRDLAKAQNAILFLAEPITGRFTPRIADGTDFYFTDTDRLVSWLNANRSPFSLDLQPDVLEFLTEREREYLLKTRARLVLPLVAAGRLIGFASLGPRTDSTRYSRDEIHRLAHVAAQAAVSIENASMYRLQDEHLSKLFHADRLSSVGELAAGAAHEIRNPLTAIRSAVQFLRDSLPEDRRPLADGVISEADRIDRIIKGMLSLSRSSVLELAPTNLPELVDTTLALLEGRLRKQKITATKAIGDPNITIPADKSQLQQVLLNVCLNSIEAMPDGGTLAVKVDSEPGHTKEVELSVSDTGPGIPAENLPRVFDPFFTTKDSGTGLGLSICYGIVVKHGGDIQIESETAGEKRGTTVRITLPYGMAYAP